jgi:hypothetical protein
VHFSTQTLNTLDLSECDIGPTGAQHLADVLENNTVTLLLFSSFSYMPGVFSQTLTTFDLWRNEIGDDMERRFCAVMKKNTELNKQS